jgi:glycosyltransferase involved in cell wall biosynthesis
MPSSGKLVSVVIPTRNRSHLVPRAVHSVLEQTWPDIEVVVIVDGHDPATREVLAKILDPRLSVIELETSRGAQTARNDGIAATRGSWVAFLDDDDEWLPQKIERQMQLALASRFAFPIVSCGIKETSPQGDVEWPKRPPRNSESIRDYLFLRHREETSEIRLQTSTLLMPKDLLIRAPWRAIMHDEWDLLLRASAIEGAGLEYAAGPLSIWHSDGGLERLSTKGRTWRDNSEWLHSMRDYVGPRAYASFLLTTMSTWAHKEQDYPGFFMILWRSIRYGRPSALPLVEHISRWFLPARLRENAKRFGRHRSAPTVAES